MKYGENEMTVNYTMKMAMEWNNVSQVKLTRKLTMKGVKETKEEKIGEEVSFKLGVKMRCGDGKERSYLVRQIVCINQFA